jgi:hypothetical protein
LEKKNFWVETENFSAPTTQLTAQVTPKVKDSFIFVCNVDESTSVSFKGLLYSLLWFLKINVLKGCRQKKNSLDSAIEEFDNLFASKSVHFTNRILIWKGRKIITEVSFRENWPILKFYTNFIPEVDWRWNHSEMLLKLLSYVRDYVNRVAKDKQSGFAFLIVLKFRWDFASLMLVCIVLVSLPISD